MYTANSPQRVKEILDFITEITLGNYTYTLPLRNSKDELEQIALSLNIMVEEIDTTVHQINHEKSKEAIQNLVFHLDQNFQITSYSQNVIEVLKYTTYELINQPITFILNEGAIKLEEFPEFLKNHSETNLPFPIELKHISGILWSGYGYIHQLIYDGEINYTLSAFRAIYYNEKLKNSIKSQELSSVNYPSEYRSLLLQDQRILVRKLHNYVMQRLDRKLKKIPVISTEVGGSVSKIKAVFKHTYGETIYAYHLRKRLEKAQVLLRETSIPVNEIAEDCGFKSFSHFSRTFKREYGISPSQIRKFSIE